MFRGLFKKKSPEKQVAEAEHGSFSITPWLEADEAGNGNAFGEKASSHGRYEVAAALHAMGTKYYADHVVQGMPGDPPERLERFQQHLQSLREKTAEFPLLIETRARLMQALAAHPDGIDRDDLKKEVGHPGKTTWGVICNQLARGGFIHQEAQGKKYILRPTSAAPVSNEVFLQTVIPAPGTSGLGF